MALTPWPLLLSWTLVRSEPTFIVFSFSLKFTVVQDRHQRRLFALLTRCRPHSIIYNMVYHGEICRPPSLSEGVFMSVFIPSSEEDAFTHLECFHNLFSQSWRGLMYPGSAVSRHHSTSQNLPWRSSRVSTAAAAASFQLGRLARDAGILLLMLLNRIHRTGDVTPGSCWS